MTLKLTYSTISMDVSECRSNFLIHKDGKEDKKKINHGRDSMAIIKNEIVKFKESLQKINL